MAANGNDTVHGRKAWKAWNVPGNLTMAAATVVLLATAGPSGAGAFSIDTSKMVGFKVVTADDDRMSARDMVVIEYSGSIAYPMAENLRAIWDQVREAGRFEKVVLRLNSAGGDGAQGEEVVGLLAEIRDEATFVTLVGDNDLCASMCIGVFVQGEQRYASPASSWMFHGASVWMSNIPDPILTARYLDLFRARGVGEPSSTTWPRTTTFQCLADTGSRGPSWHGSPTSSPTYCPTGGRPIPSRDCLPWCGAASDCGGRRPSGRQARRFVPRRGIG